MALQLKRGCPEQFACQKQPAVPLQVANVVLAPHASPVIEATPVHWPRSLHPGAREHTAACKPVHGSGVPLHVPLAT
jgi:hypothetical protein